MRVKHHAQVFGYGEQGEWAPAWGKLGVVTRRRQQGKSMSHGADVGKQWVCEWKFG